MITGTRATYEGIVYVRTARRVLVAIGGTRRVRLAGPRTTRELNFINRVLDDEGWEFILADTEDGVDVYNRITGELFPLIDREWLEV